MNTIIVKTKNETYPIYIGKGVINQIGSLLKESLPPSKVAIIGDKFVLKKYRQNLISSLLKEDFLPFTLELKSKEEDKNIFTLNKILNFLAFKQVLKNNYILSFGGGFIGDISGLASSIYLRGISFIQAPTTLLSAVDSSIGGKSAVNLDSGKNLVGSFVQPKAVFIDLDIIKALPKELVREGLGEIIKAGILKDKNIIDLLKENDYEKNIEQIIISSIKVKSYYVEKDEFDKNERHFLNLGHTFAHSIEKKSNYTISHGTAVCMGLVLAIKLSIVLNLAKKELLEEVTEVFKLYNLTYISPFKATFLKEFILMDKKRENDEITFVLVEKIGKCVLKEININELDLLLEKIDLFERVL